MNFSGSSADFEGARSTVTTAAKKAGKLTKKAAKKTFGNPYNAYCKSKAKEAQEVRDHQIRTPSQANPFRLAQAAMENTRSQGFVGRSLMRPSAA